MSAVPLPLPVYIRRLARLLEATDPSLSSLQRLCYTNADCIIENSDLILALIANTAHPTATQLCIWLLTELLEPPNTLQSIKVWRHASTGETVLHLAAARGDCDILSLYLAFCPIALDWTDNAGASALHHAAALLLDSGADIDLADAVGDSPLH